MKSWIPKHSALILRIAWSFAARIIPSSLILFATLLPLVAFSQPAQINLSLNDVPDRLRGFWIDTQDSSWFENWPGDVLDFDGDGNGDILLSNAFALNNRGRVILLYGPFSRNYSLTELNTPDGIPGIEFQGTGSSNQFQLGQARAIGDFDKDGIEDFVLVTPTAITIMYGHSRTQSDQRSTRILRSLSGSMPEAIPVGDLNGDGNSDIFVWEGCYAGEGLSGNTNADPNQPHTARIIFGHPNLPNEIPIDRLSDFGVTEMTIGPVFQTYSSNCYSANRSYGNERFYLPVQGIGRFDGDIYDDLAILTRPATGTGWQVVILYGRAQFPSSISLTAADLPTESLLMLGPDNCDSGGVSRKCDLNGDGLNDFLFGTNNSDNNAGTQWVVWGKEARRTGFLDLTNPVSCNDAVALNHSFYLSGFPVGDLNGDSVSDFVDFSSWLGAANAYRVLDPNKATGGCRLGSIYALTGLIKCYDDYGLDVDRDGIDDLIGRAKVGDTMRIYIIYGSKCLGHSIRLTDHIGYPESFIDIPVYASSEFQLAAIQFVIDTPMTFVPPQNPMDLVRGTALEAKVEQVIIEPIPNTSMVSVALFADVNGPGFSGKTFPACPDGIIARLKYHVGPYTGSTDLPITLTPQSGNPVLRTVFTSLEGREVDPQIVNGKLKVIGFFTRGDANADKRVSISDIIFTLRYLFLSNDPDTLPVICHNAADANGDGSVNVSDPVYTLMYLFEQGAAPPIPSPPSCGLEPSGNYLPGDCTVSCP